MADFIFRWALNLACGQEPYRQVRTIGVSARFLIFGARPVAPAMTVKIGSFENLGHPALGHLS